MGFILRDYKPPAYNSYYYSYICSNNQPNMKEFVLLLFFASGFYACMGPSAKNADEKFKDSVALADGNKVLGSLRFGISKSEFETQREIFLKENNDSIYGYYIHDIRADFTPLDQLYQIRFISSVYKEMPREETPFREFCMRKFGKENYPGHWKVGNRSIYIIKELAGLGKKFAENMIHQNIAQRYKASMANRELSDEEIEYKWNGCYEFYMLQIVNDSLLAECIALQNEQWTQQQLQQQKEKVLHQVQLEQRKEKDINNL